MIKRYNEEFKKQMVQEYLKGTSYPKLSKEYQVAKSTLVGWEKNTVKNASLQSHKLLPRFQNLQRRYTSFRNVSMNWKKKIFS